MKKYFDRLRDGTSKEEALRLLEKEIIAATKAWLELSKLEFCTPRPTNMSKEAWETIQARPSSSGRRVVASTGVAGVETASPLDHEAWVEKQVAELGSPDRGARSTPAEVEGSPSFWKSFLGRLPLAQH